jgi:hypothetical protein
MVDTNIDVKNIYEPGQPAQAVGAEPRDVSPGDTAEQDVYRAVRHVPVNLKLSHQTVRFYVPRRPTVQVAE